jgi:rRNA maturation protein Rpf1
MSNFYSLKDCSNSDYLRRLLFDKHISRGAQIISVVFLNDGNSACITVLEEDKRVYQFIFEYSNQTWKFMEMLKVA